MSQPGKVMQAHIDLQKESSIGIPSKMRQCVGCNQRRSIAQFKGDSVYCLKCVRRMPKDAA